MDKPMNRKNEKVGIFPQEKLPVIILIISRRQYA